MIEETRDAVANAGIEALLATRTFVDVDRYERLDRSGERGGEPPEDFTGDFVFSGVRDQRRIYGRPGALAA